MDTQTVPHSDTVEILTICTDCRAEHVLAVSLPDYQRYCSGAAVQHAFPTMSADDRERLVSGLCPTCWLAWVGDDE